MNETDDRLVAQAVEAPPGDLRAFDELVRRHEGRVQTNCRYLSGNDEDALDLAQEVLVKAYFNLKSFESRSQFGTWLNRIKVNHCLNHLRRQTGRVHVDLAEPGMEARDELRARETADRRLERDETRRRIGQTLDRMSETLRIPLILRDLDGLSYEDIAEELELGLSAVKMRIKRAREEFRELYAQETTVD